jgi:hypothetical protein
MTRTLALVESPVQLLNLLEWAHSRRDEAAGEDAAADTAVDVAVLPPKDTVGHAQLRLMADIAGAEGHRVRWIEARASRAALARGAALLAPHVASARRLLLGDPFSRLVQTMLPLARSARELVVVDDGTATMEFVTLLGEGRPLVRWHRVGGAAAGAAHACRMLTPTGRRAVELFTAMPVTPPAGVRHSVNRFAWTRATYGPPLLTGGVDLVGTSLVETGVVQEERYLAGVAALARSQGATRYLAHRREHDAKLARLVDLTGLEIVRPRLPLEIEARRGPIGSTVVSFPSTVVHTLPLALAGTEVRVAVCDIDPTLLTENASPRAQGFLSGVTGTARDVTRLSAITAA